MPLRSDYIIEFSAPEMVTKRVQIDSAAVLSGLNDGFADLDMSLFAYVEVSTSPSGHANRHRHIPTSAARGLSLT